MSDTGTDLEDLQVDTAETVAFADPVRPDDDEAGYGYYQSFHDLFKFRTEDFISRPTFSKLCDIEENILEFDFSYGYDCRKPFNLVLADEHTLMFGSGNLIHFLDVETREIWFRRSALGGGIGHITKNPNIQWPHIAIGENGRNPPIIIYEWPSMEIVTVLRGGTSRIYTHLNYNPEGTLLASQGGEPDYLITIWNWPKSTILLRSKSFSNDVARVMFSPEVPGQLTTCGSAHIKFWKMSNTFTGLKLKGELGRFGKTEYSDILGIYPMADEKVISGCFWGNILVWEEGLIKVEVCRKNRKRCHDGPIVQFDYRNGELWTVSMDGHVRVWFYDTIDQADPPDEDRFVLLEPTYDFYTAGAQFMSIVKQYVEDLENTTYFAQDAKGAIWRIDLSTENEPAESERLLKTHAGVVVGLGVCPWGPYFATLGIGGWLHLYNYEHRKLLMMFLFPAKGVALIWVPLDIDPSGEVVLMGFDDGTVRVAIMKIYSQDPSNSKIITIQVEKPHNQTLILMSFNPTGSIFITAGQDGTLFVFKVFRKRLQYIRLKPIGYITTPANISCVTWHRTIESMVICGCEQGYIVIAELPTDVVHYTKISFLLKTEPTIQRFKSYKSQIKRDIYLRHVAARKAEKRNRKMEELKKVRKENPGIDIDEDLFLADSESEEKLPPLYIPKNPNKIVFIQHTLDDTLWLSMDGYDCGYIYEYKIGQTDEVPYRFTAIAGAEDMVINKICYTFKEDFIFFAMQDGAIRVNRANKHDWHDLSNFWTLTMHSNQNGFISGFALSFDESFLLTSGWDGNVFTFRFNPDGSQDSMDINIVREIPSYHNIHALTVGACYEMLSIEETIVKAEDDRITAVANAHKEEYQISIKNLRRKFAAIQERNNELPPSQQIPIEELIVDQRVVDHLQEKLDADIALVKRKFEFNVEKSEIRMMKLKRHFIDCLDVFPIIVSGINNDLKLLCIKQRKLDDNFDQILEEVDKKIAEAELKGRPPERAPPLPPKLVRPKTPEKKLEYFLAGLSPEVIENELGARIYRLLGKYRTRKEKREHRAREWEIFNALKPSDLPTDAEDDAIIIAAKKTIGEFKLKTAADYKVPREQRETTFKKYKELLLVRKKQFDLANIYNRKVHGFREKKRKLHELITKQTQQLKDCQEELKPEDCAELPAIFEFKKYEFSDEMVNVQIEMPGGDDGEETEQLMDIVPAPTKDVLCREVLEKLPHLDEEEGEKDSLWERDIRQRRYMAKLFLQEQLVKKFKESIKQFDESIRYLRMERVDVMVQHNFVNLHLLTLNQELMVLKDCEKKEDQLSDRVNVKIVDLLDIQDILTTLTNEIDTAKKDIDKLTEREKELQRTFFLAASENKFFDFLRRIFKKKYRPPRVHTDDESDSDSSSSSSDESEDEDAGSIDSKDFGIIRLDENVCPKGCEPTLYDLTFNLRSQRHAVEAEIKELNRKMEFLRKDYENASKKYRVIDLSLQDSQNELETYQREKQSKLNQIMCTIVLKLDQIQNFNAANEMNYIKDSILIDRTVLSGLYRRVGELRTETKQQKAKHKLSLTHIQRMKTDFKYMMADIKKLKTQIQNEMRIKFGGPCKLDEMEEFMLKKLIYDLKLSRMNIKDMFTKELDRWYQIHKDRQINIMRTYKKNTQKLELLTLLSREKKELSKMLVHQDNIKDNFDSIVEKAESIKDEIKKLDGIVQDQNKEIELLKIEIKKYKTKGFMIRSERPTPEMLKEVDETTEEESDVQQWEDLDDYMYTESYAKQYWAHREVEEARKTRHEVIMGIMNDLFKNMKIEIERYSIVKLLKKVIADVLNKADVEQIINDILTEIPVRSDQDNSMIELAAEKLASIDNMEDENPEIPMISNEIMLQLIDDAVMEGKQADDVSLIFVKLIPTLIDNLPLHVIMDPVNISLVSQRIRQYVDLEDSELIDKITDNIQMKTLEARIVLTEILDRICDEVDDIEDQ